MPIALTIAQYHMDYGDHMDRGWGWGMAVLMALVVVALIALVVWVVRTGGVSRGHSDAGSVKETPMEILDRRLAESEITPDEYNERAAILAKK